jgi:hypothetical protein
MPLLRNPLTMRGRILWCYLLTFRTPEADARALLPPELELVTKDGWAFWNMVVCEIARMRPAFVPSPVGLRYRHVAYRLYAKFRPEGQDDYVEGLHFLRSDCNVGLMSVAGNLLTDFNFHTAPVDRTLQDAAVTLDVRSPDAPAQITLDTSHSAALSPGSPFATPEEASAFLKYKPRGLSVDERTREINVVQIIREEDAWKSRLVPVTHADIAFFRDKNVYPEVCFDVEPIDYQWNRGRNIKAARRV